MQYEISIEKDIACITIEGQLNSLDLLFMLQSKECKNVISQYKKILLDYTHIYDIALTEQDVIALTMLGKRSLENIEKINIAVAVNDSEQKIMEKVTKSVFATSESNISVTNSKANAMKILL